MFTSARLTFANGGWTPFVRCFVSRRTERKFVAVASGVNTLSCTVTPLARPANTPKFTKFANWFWPIESVAPAVVRFLSSTSAKSVPGPFALPGAQLFWSNVCAPTKARLLISVTPLSVFRSRCRAPP